VRRADPHLRHDRETIPGGDGPRTTCRQSGGGPADGTDKAASSQPFSSKPLNFPIVIHPYILPLLIIFAPVNAFATRLPDIGYFIRDLNKDRPLIA